MSPEAQRIAIAKACGYKKIRWFAGRLEGELNERLIISIPDYLNDLNAMNEAEEVLTVEQHARFRDQLAIIVGHSGISPIGARNYVSATAAQRAEAFLRAKDLWKDAAETAIGQHARTIGKWQDQQS